MGRLIYENKLKADLEKAISKNEDMDCLDFLRIAFVIDKQPTAYDPDREEILKEHQIKERKVIATYHDINEAARTLKCNSGNIVRCCKGEKKTAYGYQWKYAESEEVHEKCI